MAYSIDSSGILDLFRYYPPDVFPTIWTQMDVAARRGIIFAIDEVYRELEKKDDVAFEWLKPRRTIVVELDTEIQQRVAAILAVYPRLIDTRKNRSSGDPFVIALAQSRKFSVVTGEKPSGVLAKPNIPDVCIALKIPWMNVLSMFRNEGWKA
ncbi:MAG TPA: DUF4411 family protein [Candidatus Acidoferrum sp.]|nr:DUF4411 family protein [Candidatus Acidoferrum sp.]